MHTTLEDKLGLRILNLIKKKRIDAAAELAYREFGLERAIKIFVKIVREKEQVCLQKVKVILKERLYYM